MEHKLTVLGGGGVGKSTLTIRFALGTYIGDEYDPTVEDTFRKQASIDGSPAYLHILDTAGQEQYAAMRDSWIRAGEGYLMVFDVSSHSSFEEIDPLVEGIKRVKDVDSCEGLPIIVVGNKCDIVGEKRKVSRQEAEAYAARIGCTYLEASAKEDVGVIEPFDQVVREIRQAAELKAGAAERGRRRVRTKPCTIL